VPSDSLESLLDRLDELKRPRGEREFARLLKLLLRLEGRKFRDAASLIRFHESLLFMRAYPQTPEHLSRVERLLFSIKNRVDELSEAGADLSPFSEPDVSGIAGTSFSALFSYEVVRELAMLYPRQVSIDWDGYEEYERFAAVLSKFLPLIEENAYVEPRFPFLEWLHAAQARKETDLSWLVSRFEKLDVSERERAFHFNSLKVWLRWEFRNDNHSRTRMKRPVSKVFYHDAPLIERREVSLERELKEPPMTVERLSRGEGRALLDMGRTTMATRYRELHGFTYGDAGTVVRADAGRGVELFAWGVPSAWRLPTLGYTAALILKNGVPHGYAEALSLFERAETGLNLFYTFRDGESAWIYARVLRLFEQRLGVTVFSIDPYQLGFHNEEGIESGAYWFYRKLGFRPIEPELFKLVMSEEKRIARRKGYRTPAASLRRLASGHVIYEQGGEARGGEWDSFHMRNLGMAVQHRMGEEFHGDAEKMRVASVREVARALDVKPDGWSPHEQRAFSDWALLLALVPKLSRWSEVEKGALVRALWAKAGPDETRYIRLLQKVPRLREEIIRLGSSSTS
jgi:hypothetical protein